MANSGEETFGCLLVMGFLAWGGYAAWGHFKPASGCPTTIPAYPDFAASGISWGTGKVHPMEANIDSVAAECIPPDAPGEKTDSRGYSIAITAKVSYKGAGDWFDYNSNQNSTVIFECETKKQIVLGSQESVFHFVRNSQSGTVSAKITGLTAEEIARTGTVVARWKY